MKWVLVVLALALVALSEGNEEELPLAEPCDERRCQLPDCRCSSTNIPGGLNARDTPQFVLLTFDGAVNIINIETYRTILSNRRNFNGCPVGTTFFVNHEYNNYQLVNELYNNGFEIALNSISSQTSATYWATASYEEMKLEFADQKIQMTHFANIPYESLKGIRIPFFQMAGNSSFEVMKAHDLQYDSTWTTNNNPGFWPYTLDYASTQDCGSPPCPTASIPGMWVLPFVSWMDLEGVHCTSIGSCYWLPATNDEDAWFRFIVGNFERHYLGSRAPFSFHINEWLISYIPAVRGAIFRFFDMINNLSDVFMVNSHEVIDWVRDPIPIDQYRARPCRNVAAASCPAFSCGPLTAEHNIWSSYWMDICNVCPNVYPWLRNPLGQ